MKTYRLHPDVVLAQVCGEAMLIAAGSARGKLPYVKGINPAGAYFWRLMEKQTAEAEIVRQVMQDFDVSEETAHTAFRKFYDILKKNGYLSEQEENP